MKKDKERIGGSNPSKPRSGFLTTLLVILSLLALLAAVPSLSAKLTVVGGLIEAIDGRNVRINGKYFDLKKTPLKNPSGKPVGFGELKTGTKIDIFVVNGEPSSVVVYEYAVE